MYIFRDNHQNCTTLVIANYNSLETCNNATNTTKRWQAVNISGVCIHGIYLQRSRKLQSLNIHLKKNALIPQFVNGHQRYTVGKSTIIQKMLQHNQKTYIYLPDQ